MPPKKATTDMPPEIETAEQTPAPKKAKSASQAVTKKGPSAAELAASIIKKKMGVSTITAYTGALPHVSTGSFAVDDLIGGTLASDGKPKCPGFPRRRITEVFGAESSGKTTGALQSIAECQRNGGVAMFLDFEHALDHAYAKAIGVNFESRHLALYQPDTLEEGMKYIYIGIMTGVDIIVVDSVAAMVPKADLEKGADEAATIGSQARAFSRFLPMIGTWLWKKDAAERNPEGTALVFINQIRATISKGGPGGGGPETNTSGGKAIKFYAYLRLLYTKIKAEYIESKNKFNGKKIRKAFGNHTQVKVIKSKIDAKQGQAADIFIRFGQGIDDALSLIEAGVNHRFVKKEGSWYVLNGERYQGREKLRTYLKENRKAFEDLRKKVLASVQAGAVAIAEDNDAEDGIDDDEFEAIISASPSEEVEDTSHEPEEVTVSDDESGTDD